MESCVMKMLRHGEKNRLGFTLHLNYQGDENEPVTLRTVTRNCMKFYDPLGLASNFLAGVKWKKSAGVSLYRLLVRDVS